MPKTFHPKVLTANDLINGNSVFLTPEGWSDRIADAMTALTPDQASDLEALGSRGVDQNDVVGPYLVDVSLDSDAPVPLTRRERIRAAGRPSIAFIEAPKVGQAA
ncbi:MAG: DUF2849 domain-containing protein [Pseudomonadota bacterium]